MSTRGNCKPPPPFTCFTRPTPPNLFSPCLNYLFIDLCHYLVSSHGLTRHCGDFSYSQKHNHYLVSNNSHLYTAAFIYSAITLTFTKVLHLQPTSSLFRSIFNLPTLFTCCFNFLHSFSSFIVFMFHVFVS